MMFSRMFLYYLSRSSTSFIENDLFLQKPQPLLDNIIFYSILSSINHNILLCLSNIFDHSSNTNGTKNKTL